VNYTQTVWAACVVTLLCLLVHLTGCTAAEQRAFADTLKPIVKVSCAVARRVAQACPLAEAAVGVEEEETSGDEDAEDSEP
jgi:hypothetical protein